MNKILVLCILLFPITTIAGFFGPDNFEECVLKEMKGQDESMLDFAVKACKQRFPEKPKQRLGPFDKELRYPSDATGRATGWWWHDEDRRIQKKFVNDDKKTLLRRVYMDKNYLVGAQKEDDYSLSARIHFFVDCEPNTGINTGQKYSGGEDKVLECSEDGDYLSFGVSWDALKGAKFTWSFDFGGFSFSEDFREWDFELLDREVTLKKAQKNK